MDENNITLDPVVEEFLDARTIQDKLDAFYKLTKVDDDMINIMAMAIDTQIRPGTVEERLAELKACLLTMGKYECPRLRS